MKKYEQEESLILEIFLTKNTFPIEFKNYRDLCNFLMLEPTGGDTKRKRLSFIIKAFDTEIDGLKIIIKKFNGIPIPNNINKISKEILTFTLENYFHSSNKSLFVGGYTKISKSLGFINSVFSSKKTIDFSELFNTTYLKYDNYSVVLGKKLYDTIKRKYKYIIDKCLEELQKEKVISYKKHWYNCPLEYKSQIDSDFDNPKYIFNKSDIIKRCTDLECLAIEEIKNLSLYELGCSSFNEAFKKNQYSNYLKLFEEKIIEKMQFGGVYHLFEINLTEEYLNENDPVLTKNDFENLRELNNKLFKESLLDKQNKKIDNSNLNLTLEYLTLALESGWDIMDVYRENRTISDDDYVELIPTSELIIQSEKALNSQRNQISATIECICTLPKS